VKREETIALQYLNSLGLGNFKYEPDGNIPPDFSLDRNIAVEVRRLNENYFTGTDAEGLEQLTIPLHKTLERVLSTYDSRYNGSSYWVGITYKRTFPRSQKKIENQMHIVLDNFLKNTPTLPASIEVTESIRLDILPATPKQGKLFRHGVSADWDSGGFLASLFIKNIFHCLDEKNHKIVGYASKYSVWWLLLVDNIGWDLMDEEVTEIKTAIINYNRFSKLIVRNGNGSKCLLDLSNGQVA
jgi:hypothetical protein